jgi:MFS transporter, SP family, solute carrier family 2 (myo-inositol transporter), member 13
MYYSATLFKEIGFNQPTAVGLIVSGTNFIFTLVALKYIDIVGRRKIMVISAPGMIFGLTLASIAFHCTLFLCCKGAILSNKNCHLNLKISDLTKDTGGNLVDGTHYSTAWSAIVLLSMIIFVASYATGQLNPIIQI